MFQSFPIGTLGGVRLRLHSTFLMLLAWIAFTGLLQAGPAWAALQLLFPLIVFAMVLLHELGHAWMARQFGIDTRDITLYPIGGVARLSGQPRTFQQEMAVAFAGPAVNLVLGAAAWSLLDLTGSPLLSFLAWQLASINLGLALFNLLPAFPMDGGRILRAYLSMKKGRSEATRQATRIGQGMAWAMGLFGLITGSLNLVLIAVLVYLACRAEMARNWLTGGWRRF